MNLFGLYEYSLVNIFIFIFVITNSFIKSQNFNYERMHKHGAGRKIIPRVFYFPKRDAYPEPLPSTKRSPIDAIPRPYRSLFQGNRKANDSAIFRRRFTYPPQPDGHQIFCQVMFDCIINHVALQTSRGIPIILRGGVGYRYIAMVIRAKPHEELTGSIRIYCPKTDIN